MICEPELGHCPILMDRWQHRAAFVVQLRPETDVEAGHFEGKVEHVATCKATRFHSLEELLAFIATTLSEDKDSDPE